MQLAITASLDFLSCFGPFYRQRMCVSVLKWRETGQKIEFLKIGAPLFKMLTRSPPEPIFTLPGAISSLNLGLLAKNGSFFGMYGKSYTFCRTTLHGSGRQISPDLIWETNEPILSSGKPGLQHILKRKNWPRTPPYPLNNLYLGPYFFYVAFLLRQAMLLSVLLFNSETWLKLTKASLKKIESVDQMLLRRILQTPISTPIVALYLETGCVPIRFVIKEKRIMFLHHILTREEDALISRVFWAQVNRPAPGDWCHVVTEDLKDLGMEHLTFSAISEMKKDTLKTLLKKQVMETALNYLEGEKEKSSKFRSRSFPYLRTQPYLSNLCSWPSKIKLLYFQWRTRMIKVGYNYGSKDKCPICSEADDTQQHLLICPKLNDDCTTQTHTEFILDCDKSDNSDQDWDLMYLTLKRLEKAIRCREILLEQRDADWNWRLLLFTRKVSNQAWMADLKRTRCTV